jgi:hypothetical protein
MDESDANELMRHTLGRLRDAGMEELTDRVTAELGQVEAPPSEHLLRMLDALDAEIRPHAAETTERIMIGFQEIVRTRDGEVPRDLRLDLVGAHRDLFDTDSVSLAGPRLGDVLDDLDRLRTELRDDFRRGRLA